MPSRSIDMYYMLISVGGLPLLSLVIYYWMFDAGREQHIIHLFILYSAWISVLSRMLIFKKEYFEDALHSSKKPPLRPHWKRWFVVLYTPYIIYSIWFGIFMAQNSSPWGLLFIIITGFYLYRVYLKLSTGNNSTLFSKEDKNMPKQ